MYHKATEGLTVRDDNYKERRAEAKAFDFPFGAYHFARPSGGDAVKEAQFFILAANPQPGDLRPALDLETREFIQGAALVRWADDFCKEVQRLTGVLPVVYTPYTLSQWLEDSTIFWVPRYNNENTRPVRDWDIFQFSNGKLGVPNSVAGIGHVDLNYSPKVSLAELRLVDPDPVPPSRGRKIDSALHNLSKAKGKGERGRLIQSAMEKLRRIKFLR
jgi:lysozyme